MYSNLTREIFHLAHNTEMSWRGIGRHFGISHNTVGGLCRRAKKLGLDWPAVQKMDDLDLEAAFNGKRLRDKHKRLPDWARIHQDLQRKGVTLMLLWEEYCMAGPEDAYSYSQFTQLYREWLGHIDVVMRQVHRAGQCAFVDFSGKKLWYTDVAAGVRREVEIFVGTLGCSRYTYLYAAESQSATDWVIAIRHMLEFFGGVPEAIVSDNLKAAVIKAGRDPVLNRTYLEEAKHYGFFIASSRVETPRDNSPAENAVRNAQRRALAVLRNRTFFSRAEINAALVEILPALNSRPFAKMPGSRLSWFKDLDQPALKPLPAEPYEFAEWKPAVKVPRDYHIRVGDHYYSVPHVLAGSYVESRLTATTLEFFQGGKRVASHFLSNVVGGQTTKHEHQHPSHQAYADHTPAKYQEWAQGLGASTLAVVEAQFDGNPHGLRGLKACNNLKYLARHYGVDRLDAACKRALEIGSPTVKSVRSILQHGLDARLPQEGPVQVDLPLHHNIRGSGYYAGR